MTWRSSAAAFEDDGLASLLAASAAVDRAADAAAGDEDDAAPVDPSVLQRVRDVLQSALAGADQRWALDPFSPADERYRLIEDLLRRAVLADRARGGVLSGITPTPRMVRTLYAQTLGWGPAQPYLDDPNVTEVKIVGTLIFVQEQGKPFVRAPATFDAPSDVVNRALLLAALLGVQLDESQPQRSLPVSYGTRMHVTIPPRSRDGALVCIRRGRSYPWTLRDLEERGMLDHEVSALLRSLVDARCPILIAGRTGSGKTTLLEALVNSAGGCPHVIIIEDNVSEIRVDAQTRYVTYLTADTSGNARDYAAVVREALRQTPDIACPGETRGVEAGATIQLALTGHQVVTTLHATDPQSAVTRMASLAAAPGSVFYEHRYHDAIADVAASFPIVVVVRQLESLAHYGRRIVESIACVEGLDEHERPKVRALATAHEDAQRVWWDVAVTVGANGLLAMRDGSALPAPLQRAMRFATSSFMARIEMLTHVRVERAREQVRLLLPQHNLTAAMRVVETAWRETRTGRIWELSALAREIIDYAPDAFQEDMRRAAEVKRRLDAAIGASDWTAAQRIVEQEVAASVALAALVAPAEGWSRMLMRIRLGREQEMAVQRRLDDAVGLCNANLHGQAMKTLESLDVDQLSPRLAIAVAELRVRALHALRAQGMTAAEAVTLAEMRLHALRQRVHPSPTANEGEEEKHAIDA